MGVKKILESYPIIAGGVMTGVNTITSSVTNVKNKDNIAIHVLFAGTGVGTFNVYSSDDGITYNALTFSPSLPSAAGVDGKFVIYLNQLADMYVYLEYVNSAGVGVLNASICGKDIN